MWDRQAGEQTRLGKVNVGRVSVDRGELEVKSRTIIKALHVM